MAKTLMTRPYILSSSRTHLLCRSLPFFFQPKELFVSQGTRSLNRIEGTRLFSSSNGEIKPQIYSDSNAISKLRFGLVGVQNRRLATRATHVNDAGSIDTPLMQSMEKKIKEHLNAESVTVKDASGDGRHVCIDVVSSAFEGQSAVNRQRMVYKAIWEELQNIVHAVDQMTTRTPSEAGTDKC